MIYDCLSVIGIILVAICSVISLAMVSIIGKAVIGPLGWLGFGFPPRSDIGAWILDISEGEASLLGILGKIELIWRYGFGCLGESSERVVVSKPLSLNLSTIDIPISIACVVIFKLWLRFL